MLSTVFIYTTHEQYVILYQYMIDTLIQKKIESLPENLRTSIQTFDWVKILPEITQRNHLHIDKINLYKRELLLNLLGMTVRENFTQSLSKQLDLTSEQANKLVQESNEYIFKPIRAQAFSKEDSIENTLEQEGVRLIDETRPNNELQDLTDTLLNSSRTPKYKQNKPTPKQTLAKKPETTNYNEPIELSDLAGVTKHRTPYTHHETKKVPANDLTKKLYETPILTKGETYNASPSSEDQIREAGNFLSHISDSTK